MKKFLSMILIITTLFIATGCESEPENDFMVFLLNLNGAMHGGLRFGDEKAEVIEYLETSPGFVEKSNGSNNNELWYSFWEDDESFDSTAIYTFSNKKKLTNLRYIFIRDFANEMVSGQEADLKTFYDKIEKEIIEEIGEPAEKSEWSENEATTEWNTYVQIIKMKLQDNNCIVVEQERKTPTN